MPTLSWLSLQPHSLRISTQSHPHQRPMMAISCRVKAGLALSGGYENTSLRSLQPRATGIHSTNNRRLCTPCAVLCGLQTSCDCPLSEITSRRKWWNITTHPVSMKFILPTHHFGDAYRLNYFRKGKLL